MKTRNRVKSVPKLSRKYPSIEINDVFEELVDRNRELEQQIKLFVDFKLFFEQIFQKLSSFLTENQLNKFKRFDVEFKKQFGKQLIKFDEKSKEIDKRDKDIKSAKIKKETKSDYNLNDSHFPNDCSQVIKFNEKTNEKYVEKPFVCAFIGCGQSYRQECSLRRHQWVHKNRKLVCNWEGCHYTTSNRECYKRHYKRHGGMTSLT